MAASRNVSRAATNKNGAPALMASSRFKAEGEKEFLVLLVQFNDIPFKVENPKEAFDQMLNSDNYTETTLLEVLENSTWITRLVNSNLNL